MVKKEHILSYKDDYESEVKQFYSGKTIEDEIRDIVNNYYFQQGYGRECEIDLLYFNYDKNAINPFGEKIYDKDDAKYFREIYRNENEISISDKISITNQDDTREIVLSYDDYSIIEIHSTDEIIWLDNKDNSDYLKLYFKYYELDDHYRKRLTRNLWDFDSNSEAWYNQNNSENYNYALRLIDQYELDTQNNRDEDNDQQNVSNQNENIIDEENYSSHEYQIINLLKRNGKMKAKDIAKKLGLTRRDVNRILYYKLYNICEKDENYRWYIKG